MPPSRVRAVFGVWLGGGAATARARAGEAHSWGFWHGGQVCHETSLPKSRPAAVAGHRAGGGWRGRIWERRHTPAPFALLVGRRTADPDRRAARGEAREGGREGGRGGKKSEEQSEKTWAVGSATSRPSTTPPTLPSHPPLTGRRRPPARRGLPPSSPASGPALPSFLSASSATVFADFTDHGGVLLHCLIVSAILAQCESFAVGADCGRHAPLPTPAARQ